MIVCSCNALNDRALRGAIRAFRAHDTEVTITPARALNVLGGRIRCEACLAVLFAIIAEETTRPEASPAPPPALGSKRSTTE